MGCKICGSEEYVFLDKSISKVANVICRNCGLVYQYMPLVSNEEGFYKNGVYGKTHGMKILTKKHIELMLTRGVPERIKFIEDTLKRKLENIDVLDIGCGGGYELLYLMRERDCNVVGIEPFKELADFSRSMGLSVINDFFGNIDLQTKFDLIILSHTLEHFEYPNLMLQKIKSLMKENSVVYIEVPNLIKPSGKLKEFFDVSHIFTFSPITTNLILKKNRFEVMHEDLENNFIKIVIRFNKNIPFDIRTEIRDDYMEILRKLKKYEAEYYTINRWPIMIKNKYNFITFTIYDVLIRTLPLKILLELRKIKNII